MRLIVETSLSCRQRDRNTLAQEFLGSSDADLRLISMRRKAYIPPEDAAEVIRAEPGNSSEFVQGDALGRPRFKIAACRRDRLALPSQSIGRSSAGGVTPIQPCRQASARFGPCLVRDCAELD